MDSLICLGTDKGTVPAAGYSSRYTVGAVQLCTLRSIAADYLRMIALKLFTLARANIADSLQKRGIRNSSLMRYCNEYVKAIFE